MFDVIHFIREFLRVDILIGFALYSILFFITRLFFKNKEKLNQFDESATQLVIYVGLAYFIVWTTEVVLTYFLNKESIFLNRISAYIFLFWTQPIFALIPVLLLKIKFLKKLLIYRVLFSFYFLISFEQYVIIVTSLHRGRSIMNFNTDLTTIELIIHPIFKILLFLIIVSAFHYFKRQKIN
jgi:hypothetical protein